MSGNSEAKKFQYLAAKACGEIWSFNFRLMLISSYGKNIPTSTYSNWSQRQSTPSYLPQILVNTLKKRLDDVNLAYHLHTFGLDEEAGVVSIEGVSYSANLGYLITTFLKENLGKIEQGTKLFFSNYIDKRTYVFNYEDIIVRKKVVDGKIEQVPELRGEPIRAIFPVNYYALSLEEKADWAFFEVSPHQELPLSLLTLRDDFKSAILESTQLNHPYTKDSGVDSADSEETTDFDEAEDI